MGGDDTLAFLGDRVNDSRDEIGEALATAGSGLEEQGFVCLHGVGHPGGHFRLGLPFLQSQSAGEEPIFRENILRMREGYGLGRRIGFLKTDHLKTFMGFGVKGKSFCIEKG